MPIWEGSHFIGFCSQASGVKGIREVMRSSIKVLARKRAKRKRGNLSHSKELYQEIQDHFSIPRPSVIAPRNSCSLSFLVKVSYGLPSQTCHSGVAVVTINEATWALHIFSLISLHWTLTSWCEEATIVFPLATITRGLRWFGMKY